jgi:ABC-type dipeptide/oligopeptide/nickel transport system permease subunit
VIASARLNRETTSALEHLPGKRSLWRDAARRFSHNKLAVVGLLIVAVLILLAILASFLAPEGYDHQVYIDSWLYPSREHPFGTDPYGRDLFARIIYGARISLSVALVVNLASLLVGAPLGAVAGWFGGVVDYVLMRAVDVISAFPTLLFAILMLSVLGSGLVNIFLALTITSWIGIARLVRAQILSLREQEYVTAAKAMGATDWRIISQHLLPNSLTPIIVAVTFGIPAAIMGEAGLSFLGIGVDAPLPSWGKMLNEYLPYVQPYWYLSAIPGIAIALTMYAFTLMGDGLQDALDPTAGGR